jgi:hypothetical protein
MTFVINKESPPLCLAYNLYTPIEFVVIYILFKSKFREAINRKILTASFVVYFIAMVVVFFYFGILQFVNLLVCINNVFYMLWILLFLKEQYNAEDFIIRKSNPFAWYCLAILIYAPCTLIDFALYHYMRLTAHHAVANLWIIHSVCNILQYVLFSVGLFLRKQT